LWQPLACREPQKNVHSSELAIVNELATLVESASDPKKLTPESVAYLSRFVDPVSNSLLRIAKTFGLETDDKIQSIDRDDVLNLLLKLIWETLVQNQGFTESSKKTYLSFLLLGIPPDSELGKGFMPNGDVANPMSCWAVQAPGANFAQLLNNPSSVLAINDRNQPLYNSSSVLAINDRASSSGSRHVRATMGASRDEEDNNRDDRKRSSEGTESESSVNRANKRLCQGLGPTEEDYDEAVLDGDSN
jgi:hypothetical protein